MLEPNCMKKIFFFKYMTKDKEEEWVGARAALGLPGSSNTVLSIVAEPHHFSADPAPGNNFDAAPAPVAPAPAPTLLYRKAKILKRTKV
jgi:hypothetical protein